VPEARWYTLPSVPCPPCWAPEHMEFALLSNIQIYFETLLPVSTFPVKSQRNLGRKSTRSVWIEGDVQMARSLF
jgi:hypothetical protein